MTGRVRVVRDGFTLSAVETGQGAGAPVILLSNSLGAGLAMWDHQRAQLGKTHRVIGYDTRGHGQSDTLPGPCSFDDLVADALAVLDYFEVETADYVGLSLGGMTGLGLGLAAPERLNKMVCCAARADNPAAFVKSWDDRIAAIETGGLSAIWPKTLERWLTADCIAANHDVVTELQTDFLRTSPAGYAGCAAALKQLDYLRQLGGLTVPTLYISGAEDIGAPPAVMEAMATATPGAKYTNIPNAAHIVNINAPAAFDVALHEFLEI